MKWHIHDRGISKLRIYIPVAHVQHLSTTYLISPNSRFARITDEKMILPFRKCDFLSRDLLKYTSRGQRGKRAEAEKPPNSTSPAIFFLPLYFSVSFRLSPLSFIDHPSEGGEKRREREKRGKVAVNFRARIVSCANFTGFSSDRNSNRRAGTLPLPRVREFPGRIM